MDIGPAGSTCYSYRYRNARASRTLTHCPTSCRTNIHRRPDKGCVLVSIRGLGATQAHNYSFNLMEAAQDVNHFLKELEQRLTDQFLQQWKADLLHVGPRKLRSYRTFKSTFEQEPYLHLPRNLRIPLTRLRTSSHQLMTEIGRYHRPPIPVEDHLCPTCNVIEDEEHFMLECTQYKSNQKCNRMYMTL